ncbi:tail assembly protein [Klebsiella phage vB_KshKPC-M]|nr:tail assembly protein [Klebsiella phage vB_KshKPC-M]
MLPQKSKCRSCSTRRKSTRTNAPGWKRKNHACRNITDKTTFLRILRINAGRNAVCDGGNGWRADRLRSLPHWRRGNHRSERHRFMLLRRIWLVVGYRLHPGRRYANHRAEAPPADWSPLGFGRLRLLWPYYGFSQATRRHAKRSAGSVRMVEAGIQRESLPGLLARGRVHRKHWRARSWRYDYFSASGGEVESRGDLRWKKQHPSSRIWQAVSPGYLFWMVRAAKGFNLQAKGAKTWHHIQRRL